MLFEICWIYAVHLKSFTGKMFPTAESFADEISFLSESINLQGNHKVMWMALQFINGENGVAFEREQDLINNAQLRSELIRYIAI
jgi:hypothetical protein